MKLCKRKVGLPLNHGEMVAPSFEPIKTLKIKHVNSLSSEKTPILNC